MKLEKKYIEQSVIYKKTILSNGLTIISEQVKTVQSFALGYFLNVGSRDELDYPHGTAHFMEHAAFKNTGKRNSRQIANRFENLGAFTNAYTTKENICFYVNALKDNFNQVIEILTDITFNPHFKPSEIDKERNVIKEEIRSYDDDLEELIYDEADMLLYKNNGLAHQITGTLSSVEDINTEVLERFHKQYFVPENAVLSLAGNIDHNKIVKKLERLFSNFSHHQYQAQKRPVPIAREVETIVKDMQTSQAHLLFTKFIPNEDIRTRYIIAIINIILGDGLSSRLYQSLREKSGLGYSIYSSIINFEDNTNINIYIGLEEKNLNKAKRKIQNEINKLCKSFININEFKRAKNQLKSSSVIEMENMSSRMQFLAKQEIQFARHESLEESIELIESIKIEELESLIKSEFAFETWSEIRFLPKVNEEIY